MNVPSIPSTSKKKSGRPRNDTGFSSIPIKNSIPPAPILSEIPPSEVRKGLSPMIRSPIDQTPIIVNGRVVDVDSIIEERIQKASPVIKPITPVKQKLQSLPLPSEEPKTPPSLPLPEVEIVETPRITPPPTIQEEIKESFSREISTEGSKEIKSLPPPSFNFTSVLEEESEMESSVSPASTIPDSSDETYITESSDESETPRVETKIDNPFDAIKSLNLVGSYESEEEYQEDEEDSDPKEQNSQAQPFVPMISGRIRVDSPIETMGGPSSPVMDTKNLTKPMFTSEGKSFTPRRVASPVLQKTSPKVINNIYAENQIPSVKNVIQPSPKLLHRTPSPVRPGMTPKVPSPRAISPRTPPKSAPQQIQGPAMFFPPEHKDEKSIFGGRPNYTGFTPDQEAYMRAQFKAKFGILRSSYPQWEVIEPDETLTLDQIHNIYEYYVRQILVSKETGTYKVYLVIFFMFVEVVGVKLLKLNMSGYTMSQLRIMNRYDSLLVELGEKWLVQSGSEWPVEARLLMMSVFNAVIFLAVRYLCSWMGIEGISDNIQQMVDNMLNGPGSSNNNQLPAMRARPPTPTMKEASEPQGGNPLDGLASAFSGLFGGNKSSGGGDGLQGGISDGIAKLGTMFTSKLQQNNIAAKEAPKPQGASQAARSKPPAKGRIDKRTLFG